MTNVMDGRKWSSSNKKHYIYKIFNTRTIHITYRVSCLEHSTMVSNCKAFLEAKMNPFWTTLFYKGVKRDDIRVAQLEEFENEEKAKEFYLKYYAVEAVKQPKLEVRSNRSRNYKILQLTKDNELVNTFNSMREASINTGFTPLSIQSAISNQRTYKGYKWEKEINNDK